MTLELTLDLSGLGRCDPGKDVKVFVACEGSANAKEACALLERLARNTKADGRLFYSWWNFEVLPITALRKMAATEAAAADLVIIAGQNSQELPESVIDWVSQWLTVRDYRCRALMALVDSDRASTQGSRDVLALLRQVATLGQMDFFAKGTEAKLEAALLRGSAPPRGIPSWHTEMCTTGIAGRSGTGPARN